MGDPSPQQPAIDAENLFKRFGDVVAVDGLDLSVTPGTCLGLLGPNGAGKTTTINIIVGLSQPDAGAVRVLGLGWKRNAKRIRELIGVQLQETQFSDKLTVCEVLRIFGSFYRTARSPAEVLETVSLSDKRDTRYVNLSGGQRQRLALGCALINRPRLMILDEPTTGLDPQARRRVWQIIADFKQAGGTVLLTTHYMDEAEQLSDYVVIVDHGRSIAEGSPQEIIQSLGAESIIEFTAVGENVRDPETQAPASLVEGLPGLQSVRANGESTALHVTAAHETIPALMETLKAARLRLTDLRTHRPTLEDVFVTLTGRHLRDG